MFWGIASLFCNIIIRMGKVINDDIENEYLKNNQNNKDYYIDNHGNFIKKYNDKQILKNVVDCKTGHTVDMYLNGKIIKDITEENKKII